jgi:hypothetical protein
MLAQPVTLGAQTLTVTDDAGAARSVALSAGVYRIGLATSGGAGTEASPWELLSKLETALGTTRWTVALTAQGKARFTSLSTASSSITWPVDNALRNVLGFDANISGLATGASSTATYQPTHVAYSFHRGADTDWQRVPGRRAAAEMPDGTVYVFKHSTGRMRRTFDLRTHPRDAATATSRTSYATPVRPTESRWLTQVATAGTAPPWSLLDFFGTADGQRVAFHTDFAGYVAGTSMDYAACYVAAETLKEDRPNKLHVANFGQLVDWPGVSLWWVAKETAA